MVSLKFHCKDENQDFIEVEKLSETTLLFNIVEDGVCQSVVLDKSTAIKLSKELRKQIALLD